MRIGTIFTFDSAHFLPKHKGKCNKMHGHTYKLEIQVDGPILVDKHSPSDGMVMDFGDLKDKVHNVVIHHLDHTLLNDIFDNPTAEWIAPHIFAKVSMALENSGVALTKVKLWETPTSYVECHYEDIQHILEHQRGSKL